MSASNPKTFKERDQWMRDVLADGELSEGERNTAVRLSLFLHINKQQCTPGYEALAKSLSVSKSCVIRRVARLELLGWIEVGRGHRRGRLTNFRLTRRREKVGRHATF